MGGGILLTLMKGQSTSGTLELFNDTVDAVDDGLLAVVPVLVELLDIHCTNDRLIQTAQERISWK